ncbi:MAG TPA: cyclase family protein [Burkholderiales bacterium]|nr:cyclase family protein [Burkholderiales bacterium]
MQAKRQALVTVAAALLAGAAQAQTCFPSKFGPNDQVGNLNYVTPEKTLAAVKLVTKGKSYRLGIETNKNTPAFPPRSFALTIVQPGQQAGQTLGPSRTTYNDDIIMGWVGIGSQLDGLGHIGIDNVYYNCNKGAEFAQTDGLKKLGIENVPPIATRGILLDMAGYYNTDIVKEGTAFNRAEIEGAMKKQGIRSLERGDVVLFHTGWTKLIGKDNKRYGSVEPGLGVGGARYLAERGVAMVGADTWGLEVIPFEKDAGVFEVHQILLPMNGIYILENMETAEMVKDQAWEFLFTLGPSRITGAVQAIINPIAIK